jgi:ABC-type Fe3+-hydroxamate transport system substrate-binding protein
MKTERILSIVLVTVFLASVVSLAITPAAADMYYEIPGDINPHDNVLTKDELVNAILPYMLDKGDFTLDDVGDASYVYAYWNGEPKTVMEKDNREVTFYRPIERVVSTFAMINRAIMALGCCDRLVGAAHICAMPEEERACGGKLLELPEVRGKTEFIASLRPDIVIGHLRGDPEDYQKKVYTLCVAYGQTNFPSSMEIGRERTCTGINFYGEVLDKQEEAEELISFINEKYDLVTDITSQIPDSEKPKACAVLGKGIVTGAQGGLGGGSGCIPYDDAGAISLRKDLGKDQEVFGTISVEQLIKWNPDVIFVSFSEYGGTPSLTVEQVLADPQLQMVNAVKTGSVYYITGCCCWEPTQRIITNSMYMAKMFYPDEFKDLDVEKEGNEVFERFYGIAGLWTEMADELGYYREFVDNPPEQGKWQNVPE